MNHTHIQRFCRAARDLWRTVRPAFYIFAASILFVLCLWGCLIFFLTTEAQPGR